MSTRVKQIENFIEHDLFGGLRSHGKFDNWVRLAGEEVTQDTLKQLRSGNMQALIADVVEPCVDLLIYTNEDSRTWRRFDATIEEIEEAVSVFLHVQKESLIKQLDPASST